MSHHSIIIDLASSVWITLQGALSMGVYYSFANFLRAAFYTLARFRYYVTVCVTILYMYDNHRGWESW